MPCIIIGYTEVHNEKLEPRIFAFNAESHFTCVNRYQFPFMKFRNDLFYYVQDDYLQLCVYYCNTYALIMHYTNTNIYTLLFLNAFPT